MWLGVLQGNNLDFLLREQLPDYGTISFIDDYKKCIYIYITTTVTTVPHSKSKDVQYWIFEPKIVDKFVPLNANIHAGQ